MVEVIPSTAIGLRQANLSRALAAVHSARSGLTRAALARELDCTRATAAALVADLDTLGLVQEAMPPATGLRGRPSPWVLPAPNGPAVVALEIATDFVRTATVTLGGHAHAAETIPLNSQRSDHVMTRVRALLSRRMGDLAGRTVGVGIAVHGLVESSCGTVPLAPGLGWRDIDVVALLRLPANQLVHIDNIAHLSTLAETTRGCAQGVATVLYIHAAVGLGGTLAIDGEPIRGRKGFAGEYGHLPFGRTARPCRCGSSGCWETETDQLALAAAAEIHATPATAAAAAREVFTRSAQGEPRCRRAVEQVSNSLGRGIGALINVHDPDLIVLAGHAADLHHAAREQIDDAVRASAMSVHQRDLPPIQATTLGSDSGLIGAAEAVFRRLIEDPNRLAPTGPRSGATRTDPER